MNETLIYLIAGFQKYVDNDRKKLQDSVAPGFHLFVQACNKAHIIPPKNYQELINILSKPTKDWGFEDIGTYFPEDSPLIDEFLRPIPEANELLYSIGEYANKLPLEHLGNHVQQLTMRKLYAYALDNHLAEEYTKIRSFLSQPDNAVITNARLKVFLLEIYDEKLVDAVKDCYEQVTNIYNYRKCPYCHWTLRYDVTNQKWICNIGSPCFERSSLQHGLAFEEEGMQGLRYVRLKPGIQRFILIPGISEMRLKNKLKNKKFSVQLYPHIDLYDLHAERGRAKLKIDVKDYQSPFFVAKNIIQDMVQDDWNKELIYVIPHERLDQNKQYVQEVYEHIKYMVERDESLDLEVGDLEKLKVIGERQLLRLVGERADEHIIEGINKIHSITFSIS